MPQSCIINKIITIQIDFVIMYIVHTLLLLLLLRLFFCRNGNYFQLGLHCRQFITIIHHKSFEEQNGMARTKNSIKYWIRICEIEWNFHEKKIKHLVTIQQVDLSRIDRFIAEQREK